MTMKADSMCLAIALSNPVLANRFGHQLFERLFLLRIVSSCQLANNPRYEHSRWHRRSEWVWRRRSAAVVRIPSAV